MDKNPSRLNKKEDHELVSLYQQKGDLEIVGRLYNRYLELVYGLCLKYFKNKADAEDASMDIFQLVSRKLKTQDVKSFKSWLYVVSKNHCLDELRKAKRKREKESEHQLVQSDLIFHPDDIDSSEELFTQLELCIKRLSEEQKQCIELFYFQKLSYQELSEQLKMEWTKVRSNIQNGRRNLKNCMKQQSAND